MMAQPVGSNAQSSPLLPQASGDTRSQAPAFLQLVQAEAGKRRAASGSSIAILPKSPQNAPSRIDLTPLQAQFDDLWKKSDAPLPADDREYGGTLVTDRQGNLKPINVEKGEKDQFKPNLQAGPGETVQGVFHTHPKDRPEEPSQGFSADDIAAMFRYNLNAIIMQSGSDQFMYLRTAATPANISPGLIGSAHGLRVIRAMENGMDKSAAKREAAKQTAQAFGLAYYEGSNGVFTRVSP
jgi:type VI secretion system secreted protein VgrG